MKPESMTTVYGGMDKDSDPRVMDTESGFHPNARNVRLAPDNIPVSMQGTVQQNVVLPSGNKRCVGSYWDRRNDLRYDFWWDQNGNHCITRHDPSADTSLVVIETPLLAFRYDDPVTGIGLVDGQYLYWANYGEPLMLIDLERAIDDGTKKSLLNAYIPSHIDSTQRVYGASIYLDGNLVASNASFHVSNATEISRQAVMLDAVSASFNVAFSQFTAEACGGYIEFTAASAGMWSVTVEYTDTVNGIIQPTAQAIVEFTNRYNDPWHIEQLDMAAFMPPVPPVATGSSDPSTSLNFIGRRVFRFAYAYVLVDGSKTPLSPWSAPSFILESCLTSEFGNLIEVSFSADQNLIQAWTRGEISQIELFFQEGTENGWPRQWYSAGLFGKEEWAYTLALDFRNSVVPVAIDTAYTDLYAYSNPLTAKAATQIADQDNNNRLLVGNTVEDYEAPCLNIQADLEFSDAMSPVTSVDIEVWVRACSMYANDAPFWRSQPIWRRTKNGPNQIGLFGLNDTDNDDNDQTTTTGGFPVYIAGLPYLAITEQVVTYINNTSVNFIQDTTVLDGTTAGIPPIGNPTAVTGRAGIRACIVSGDIYHRAVIKGVPTGQTVIIRVADTKCGFLDDGSKLDLNNPDLLYQQSSTNIFGNEIGSGTGYAQTPNSKEIKIDIPSNATGTLFAGTLLYMDCSEPDLLEINTMTYKGYVFDDDGRDYANPGNDIREKGTSMDRTLVVAYPFHPVTGNPVLLPSVAPGADYWDSQGVTAAVSIAKLQGNTTDHNGYYFIPFKKQSILVLGVPVPCNWKMGVVSVTGNPSIPVGTVSPTASGFAATDLTIINDFNDNKWEGTLVTPNPLGGPVSGNLSTAGRFKNYIMANVNPDAQEKIRTRITGTVTSNGIGVGGVVVVYENGRWTTTEQDGTYELVLYGSMNVGGVVGANNNDRIEDRVLFHWNGPCSVIFQGGNMTSQIPIYRFWESREYSNSVWYIGLDKSASTGAFNNGPYLKRGGVYDLGAIMVDTNGRPTPVQYIKTFNVPTINDDLNGYDPITYPVPNTYRRGTASIRWSMLSPVPSGLLGTFKYLQFVITPNSSSVKYLQWGVSNAIYSSRWDPSTNFPVDSGYANPSSTEIYLSFTDSFERYREINADAATQVPGTNPLIQFGQVGWVLTPGDRLRLIALSDGTYPQSPIDLDIIGQRGRFLVIQNRGSLPEFKGGEIVELITPGLEAGESKFYREVPGAQVFINDPYGSPSWGLSTGVVQGADTWLIPSQIPVRPGYVSDTATPNVAWTIRNWTRESCSITDFWPSKVDALGRAAIEDPLAKQQERGTVVRVSNPYQPGSYSNGMRWFEPANLKVANTDFGFIQYLEEMDQVVVAPCSGARTFAIYLSRQVASADDEELIVIGGKILGTYRPFQHRYGTRNPESIVRGDTFMMWVDIVSGTVIRYDVNGLKPISTRGIETWFRSYCRRLIQYPNPRFYGGFNSEFDEYWITIKGVGRTVNGIDITDGDDTIVFWFNSRDDAATANRWICHVDLIPQYYGRSSGRMFNMDGNSVWLHDQNPVNGLFNGVQNYLRVDFLFNKDAIRKKVWLSMQVNEGGGWSCPFISNINGQQSNLIEADFEVRENFAKAAFLRDINTPVQNPLVYGDALRSTTLQVSVQNSSTGKVRLVAVSAHYRNSPET